MADSTVTTTPQITASKPSLLSIRDLLNQSWELFKKRFTVLLAITLLAVIVNAVISALVVLDIGGSFTINTLTNFSVSSAFVIGGVILGGIAMAVVYLWTQAAIIVAISDTTDKVDIKATLQKAWKYIGSYFWLSVLSGFILLGASLLFIIPGIIMGLWFSMAVAVLIVENVKGTGALVKSKRYVQGNFRDVWVRFAVLALLFIVGSFITSLFVKIFDNSVVESAINIVLSLFSTPFSMIYSYLIYKNLREIKGDVSPIPSSRLKMLLIVCGALGVLVIPVALSGIFYAAQNLAPGHSLNPAEMSPRYNETLNVPIDN